MNRTCQSLTRHVISQHKKWDYRPCKIISQPVKAINEPNSSKEILAIGIMGIGIGGAGGGEGLGGWGVERVGGVGKNQPLHAID